jgi:26S proteasome regulatory subunit N8
MTDSLLVQVEQKKTKMVVVHPTVLLSIVDHYNRVAHNTKGRVVGVLLGEYGDNDTLDITNCYAVPFEEDLAEPEIWFLDHIYLEQMFNMMRRINAKERIMGWYSSGPQIKRNDIALNEILRRYNTNPVFVVCNVQEEQKIGLPTEAFFT